MGPGTFWLRKKSLLRAIVLIFFFYRVRKVESLEELRDVYNHFLLYYGNDIVKMRNSEKAKKNEEEREKEGEEGTEEEKEHQETIKQASRKSGYTICVKNKLGNLCLTHFSLETTSYYYSLFMPASDAQLDVPSDWRPGGRGFNPHRG